jgi:beta-phosphoglucomutase-like phosphatase (HAD superfamily)
MFAAQRSNHVLMSDKNKAIIFDMDGVLTDSEWFIAEAGRLMFLETHGVTVTHDDFLPFVGHGENRFLGGVAAKYGIAAFDIERDKARTYAIYTEIVRGKLKPLPGAVEFVRLSREAGFSTALATSTDYIKMMASLREIGLAQEIGMAPAVDTAASTTAVFFDAMVNGLDVERRKPFPDIFLEAARRINISPGRCWVVEDSPGGIQAAKAAGMRCLALLTTFGEKEVRMKEPDIIVKDLSCIKPGELME